ncbi:D-alanyl-D-alanine carboxypeptidase [Paenibacillus sp. SC116]|uniref:D-alanyl-D-alanine carboxypeptidase family protein n=1 Tax=Paenibacillus sp. SC116 TaxID=2968986 RepID=UPI00215AC48C|nr:D-alanyl-D-alanine carboxypeptidase family protein [Paenibacillus sp. SC116]MCR8844315.1 D-alanyl-D-alanine carboxypeptidase [Paenibacillus sp. SC116]
MKRMKKWITFILILLLVYIAFPFIAKPDIDAKAAILMDAESGKILYSINENTPLAPASMSKIMTEYIVLEHIYKGALKWDDTIVINATTFDSEGVKIDVEIGDRLSVKDLFYAMVVSSANNAAVALAEHIAGSEEQFTQLMNEKAKQLQLSPHTYFVNATGLANENNEESRMTALDVAILSQQLLENFPDLVAITKLDSYTLEHDGTVLTATNKMLDPDQQGLYVKSVDGLKTGFTNLAGYSFAGTAEEGDKRLITVVMGTGSDAERFEETKKLLSFGFNKFYTPFI